MNRNKVEVMDMAGKDAMLHIRVSSELLDKVKSEAKNVGMSQSEFCLNAILTAIGENLDTAGMDNVMLRLKKLESLVHEKIAV